MRFFLDNNLSFRLAPALDSLSKFEDQQHQVVHLTDMFAASVDDKVWIPALSQQGGWIVISGDCKIRTKPAEKRVFQSAKLTTFFLAPGWINAKFWHQSWLLVRWWPKIIDQASKVQAGAVFEIPFRHKGAGKFSVP